jgi:general secretion pathway protein B
MSYILDALKKAESERNLGALPNVYTNAPHAVSDKDNESWGKILPWSLAAIVLGIVFIGLAWLQPWRTQPAAVSPVAAIAQMAPQAIPVTAPAAATPPPAAPPSVAQAEPIADGTPTATTSTPPAIKSEDKPAPVKPAPAPVAKPSAPVPEKKMVDVPQASETKPEAKAAAKTEAAAESKVETRTDVKAETKPEGKDVGTARDLPQAIQSQLPPISVNGYLYAKDPADRSVLMNQKLLREGDTVAPDLVLEKLLPKGAILNYKGYRYRIAF